MLGEIMVGVPEGIPTWISGDIPRGTLKDFPKVKELSEQFQEKSLKES